MPSLYHRDTIDRRTLLAIVEQAAENAKLPWSYAKRVFAEMRTTERIVYGVWYDNAVSCGCPATQAGLCMRTASDGYVSVQPLNEKVRRFGNAVDELMRELELPSYTLDVIDAPV